ncbi:MAG: zinc ABC transporter substrate-binding protein [Aestuariivita sp.]|nr:zinc ABC transporter substrate-binding protein [Aestuariivita sp.]
MRIATFFFVFLANSVIAEPIKVITDIPPVQSLVAAVMEGIGTPDLILPPGASPHDFALRPSIAQSLENSDIVFWIGPELTPQLEDPIENLATNALSLSLLTVPNTVLLPYRDTALLESDSHDEHHDSHHDEHGEEHHDEHADKHESHSVEHDDHHKEHDENHSTDHAHHHHHHDGNDAHAWLDLKNGQIWLTAIAEALANADPENTVIYHENAEKAKLRLNQIEVNIANKLKQKEAISFVVYHDAYQYFENRFDLSSRGSIVVSDVESPSAARVARIRDIIREEKIACVFSEPQLNPQLVNAIFESENVVVSQIDPIGAFLEPGPTLYENLLLDLAKNVAPCIEK